MRFAGEGRGNSAKAVVFKPNLVAAALLSLIFTSAPAAHRSAWLVIGYSVEHRPITARAIGDGPRTVLVVGSIAGDEPGGIAVAEDLSRLAPTRGVTVWVLPDVNPDGLARHTRVNAHGVDLNRNFPFRWRGGRRAGRYYPGRHASSEPEARAVEGFVGRIRPALTVWLHQPYALIDDSQGPRWAESFLGRATGLPVEPLPDYPGSAIGWEDALAPHSAFDVELPGPTLDGSTARGYAADLHLLLAAFAAR